ncbi:MAG: N-acetylmuramic acid 6-phosphate etherase [Alphaproteobacteria bacterium]|nr:N-acetylmuramic acid 6-phosphate etherase [Alphaproteobacteria bacterium]
MSKLSITESRNPHTINIDLMDSLDIVKTINEEDCKIADAIKKVLPAVASAVDAVTKAFLTGGRLAYFGAGTSGRLGVLDASEMLPTFGVSPSMVQGFIAGGEQALRHPVENAEDKEEFALSDLAVFNPKPQDVIVAISANGNPAYCVKTLKEAKNAGCTTIAISSNPEASIAKFADIFINPIVGEEVITGSSRMKSGTAQKMILNMISTGAMIRIGKTYENYMIDLQLTNKKLVERGLRFISEICGIDKQTAEKYLKESGPNVKTACVMALKKCSKEEAEKLLNAHNGILRKVI